MIEQGLELSKRIYGAYPSSFCGALIVGRRGVGKSCYALRVAHEVFMLAGDTPNDAWRKALSILKFEIGDVIKFLKTSARQPEPSRLLVWDDCGIHANSSMYFSDMRLCQQLKGVLDGIRTACSGLIMTTPTTTGLLGTLKAYDDYQIEIKHTHRGGIYRSAVAYQFHTLPSGKRIVHKRFVDSFSVYIPEWVFSQYQIMRRDALINAVDNLDKTIKNVPR